MLFAKHVIIVAIFVSRVGVVHAHLVHHYGIGQFPVHLVFVMMDILMLLVNQFAKLVNILAKHAQDLQLVPLATTHFTES